MSRRISAYQVALYVGCVAGTYAGAAVAADDHLSVSRFVVATVLLIAVAVAGSRGWHLWLVRANSAEDPSRPGKGMALFGGLALSLLATRSWRAPAGTTVGAVVVAYAALADRGYRSLGLAVLAIDH